MLLWFIASRTAVNGAPAANENVAKQCRYTWAVTWCNSALFAIFLIRRCPADREIGVFLYLPANKYFVRIDWIWSRIVSALTLHIWTVLQQFPLDNTLIEMDSPIVIFFVKIVQHAVNRIPVQNKIFSISAVSRLLKPPSCRPQPHLLLHIAKHIETHSPFAANESQCPSHM